MRNVNPCGAMQLIRPDAHTVIQFIRAAPTIEERAELYANVIDAVIAPGGRWRRK